MTQSDIEAAKAIIAAATPGPWRPCDCGGEQRVCENIFDKKNIEVAAASKMSGDKYTAANAAFIAAARTGWPAALAEVERLRSMLELEGLEVE